jgi:hypothetical protein
VDASSPNLPPTDPPPGGPPPAGASPTNPPPAGASPTNPPPAGAPLGHAPPTFWVAVRRDVRVGVRSGLHTFWVLARAMIPAYLLALVLKELGVIDWLAHVAGPVMSLLGLPGDAAVPLALGYVLNLYAAVGAMQALSLSAQQITVLALAVLIGHNLIVEGAVLRRTGMNAVFFTALRVVAGLSCAAAANLIMHAL